jgi:hypothetical protein
MPSGDEEEIAERDELLLFELLLFELLLFVFFAPVAARAFLVGANLYPSCFVNGVVRRRALSSSSVGNAHRAQAPNDVITILQLH